MEIEDCCFKSNEDGEKLIPVHINKARDNEYFWNWSSDISKWVKGEAIPESLKRAYANPPAKSNYR